MAHLKHYAYERDTLSVDTKYSQVISEDKALWLTIKACKYLKIPVPLLDIRKSRFSKFLFYNNPTNDVQKNYREITYHTGYLVSGDVAHETAHYFQYHKTGKTRHSKKMIKIVTKIQRYLDTIL